MRFLFSFTGGSGHFLPTEIFARALARRGHEVLYACQDLMLDPVSAKGWHVAASGGSTLVDPPSRRQLMSASRQAEQRVVREVFAGRVAEERANRLVALCDAWHPDLIVRDEMDFGAAVAAEALGVPHASVTVIAAGGFTGPETVEAPLSTLRDQFGLPPDQTMEMLDRFLTLVPIPPGFRDPRFPLPLTAHLVQPAILHAVGERPTGAEGENRLPKVYFSLGTIFPQESGDLFQRVLTGLRALAVEVTVTIGDAVTPEELGPQPHNVHVERYVPLEDVLPLSDVVVSHGGSGTVIGSISIGLPQVVLPMGADQSLNADRCEALSLGVVLDPLTATPDEIAVAVSRALDTPEYRTQAERLGNDARTLPDAEAAANLLEALAQSGQPINVPEAIPSVELMATLAF